MWLCGIEGLDGIFQALRPMQAAGQDVPQNSIHLFSTYRLSEDASAVSSVMARLRSQRTHLAHSQEQEGQRPYSIPL